MCFSCPPFSLKNSSLPKETPLLPKNSSSSRTSSSEERSLPKTNTNSYALNNNPTRLVSETQILVSEIPQDELFVQKKVPEETNQPTQLKQKPLETKQKLGCWSKMKPFLIGLLVFAAICALPIAAFLLGPIETLIALGIFIVVSLLTIGYLLRKVSPPYNMFYIPKQNPQSTPSSTSPPKLLENSIESQNLSESYDEAQLEESKEKFKKLLEEVGKAPLLSEPDLIENSNSYKDFKKHIVTAFEAKVLARARAEQLLSEKPFGCDLKPQGEVLVERLIVDLYLTDASEEKWKAFGEAFATLFVQAVTNQEEERCTRLRTLFKKQFEKLTTNDGRKSCLEFMLAKICLIKNEEALEPLSLLLSALTEGLQETESDQKKPQLPEGLPEKLLFFFTAVRRGHSSESEIGMDGCKEHATNLFTKNLTKTVQESFLEHDFSASKTLVKCLEWLKRDLDLLPKSQEENTEL